MATLVNVGRLGRIAGVGNNASSTSGALLSYIPVLNRHGVVYGCPYYVLAVNGSNTRVQQWVHTSIGGHVLIDATYTPLSMDIKNASGALLNYPEPIEVYANNTDFYISHYCFDKNIVAHQIIK